MQGLGIIAHTDEGQAILGRSALFSQYQITLMALPEHDGPVVGLALNQRFLGWLLLDGTIRPEASEETASLRTLGIVRQQLLTGERLSAAQRVAQHAGINELVVEALPAEKYSRCNRW
ncbi:TPA: hypothetical protein ACNO4N_005493 [Salmonella enterica subsp. enterica serovar Newport]